MSRGTWETREIFFAGVGQPIVAKKRVMPNTVLCRANSDRRHRSQQATLACSADGRLSIGLFTGRLHGQRLRRHSHSDAGDFDSKLWYPPSRLRLEKTPREEPADESRQIPTLLYPQRSDSYDCGACHILREKVLTSDPRWSRQNHVASQTEQSQPYRCTLRNHPARHVHSIRRLAHRRLETDKLLWMSFWQA